MGGDAESSAEVFRVTTEEQAGHLGEPVLATTMSLHNDPINMTPIGPFAKGDELGFTLGDWLGASGTGTESCNDGAGSVSASFSDLVPNGVYTMWLWYVAVTFPEPFAT